jgi:hypothetical protein
MAKNVQQETKINLKKYISQICYPQKALIWADLGTDRKSKDIALGRLSPAKAADALFTLIRPEF